ncbi:MAG: GNAT family N-acetyltransferase [Aeromicrobium sp.]
MTATRLATPDDAETVARMLHEFNVEFDTHTPGVAFLTQRFRALLASGDVTVVLAGDEPLGFAVLRFRPSLWVEGTDSYLEELYVVPDRRDEGIGGAIMAAAMDLARDRDAFEMHIGVDEPDVDTRRFYERLGFRNHDPDDPSARMFFYEREL